MKPIHIIYITLGYIALLILAFALVAGPAGAQSSGGCDIDSSTGEEICTDIGEPATITAPQTTVTVDIGEPATITQPQPQPSVTPQPVMGDDSSGCESCGDTTTTTVVEETTTTTAAETTTTVGETTTTITDAPTTTVPDELAVTGTGRSIALALIAIGFALFGLSMVMKSEDLG